MVDSGRCQKVISFQLAAADKTHMESQDGFTHVHLLLAFRDQLFRTVDSGFKV